jgi:hypothetical protein
VSTQDDIVSRERGRRLLDALAQLQGEAAELEGLFPSWVQLEPVPLREALYCQCGRHADYVVLGRPDYPYCVRHLREQARARMTDRLSQTRSRS